MVGLVWAEITQICCVQNKVEFDCYVEDCMMSTETIADLSTDSSAA